MDHITYDPRYQQYNGQPGYWQYGYAQHVPQSQQDPSYTSQNINEQSQGFHYSQHAQNPRQMPSNEWVLVATPNGQQAYATAQSSQQQYAQPISTMVHTQTPGYAQHPQTHMHSGISMASGGAGSVMNYHTPIHGYAYYQNEAQRSLTAYQPVSQPQSVQYTSTTLLPSAPASQYLSSRPAPANENGWQIVDCHDPHRPVDHYAEAQQPHIGSTQSMTPTSNRPQSHGSLSIAETPSAANNAFRMGGLSVPEDVKPCINTSITSHMHLDSDHLDSSSTEHDLHTPSSTSSLESRSETPMPASARHNDSPTVAASKSALKKSVSTALVKKDFSIDKRVGRRKGPLKPEQRKQAGEIRKMKACLRCKFLKKTCDTGNPCSGCTPSHARLWQVPCTRIGIQEVGYFAKDFTTDTHRDYPLEEIIGESPVQVGLWITHGFGYVLPVMARALYVKDENQFRLEWTEGRHSDTPQQFQAISSNLAPIAGSISEHVMSEYVDKHIDGGFEHFVDNHFEGTKFITEMLKTVYNYYRITKLPIVRKGLKLVVAYNLTMSITLAEGMPEDARWAGKVTDQESRKYGKVVAPLLVNYEVKAALAALWRALMNEVLIELAALYTSVYTGDKLKHWPTIFMLDTLLLAVWEEMQFDVHFAALRSRDEESSERFCQQMEGIPVGVIVGLFLAISQKLPTFLEWDSKKHHHVLNSNSQACDIMSEVKKHVTKHEDYLKKRPKECRFNPDDMDSFANKFVSRLVVRAN